MPHNRVKVVVRTRPTNNFAHENIEIEGDGTRVLIRSNKQYHGHINNQVLELNLIQSDILV